MNRSQFLKLRRLFSPSSISVYCKPHAMSVQKKTYYCPTCRNTFDGTDKYHKRITHQQETTAGYPSEQKQSHVPECNALDPEQFVQEPVPPPSDNLSHPSPSPSLRRPSRASPAPAIPRTPSPPPDMEDFPSITESEYVRVPESTTVTDHATLPLRAASIIINMELGGVIICINCGCCVTPKDVATHARAHFRGLDIPRDLGELLEAEFHLMDWRQLHTPTVLRAPIFGLKLFPDAMYFCGRCGHGYESLTVLESHQSMAARCPRVHGERDMHFIAYAQSFGFTTSKFPVDLSGLTRREDSEIDTAALYLRTFAPPPDYSLLPVALPIDNMSLDLFFDREGWIEHLSGKTPQQINALTDLPDDDAYVSRLRKFVESYFEAIQQVMKKETSHGLLRKMAQIGSTENSQELRVLEKGSLKDYSRAVVRLLFSCIRQVRGEINYYALKPEQKAALVALDTIVSSPAARADTVAVPLHSSLLSLFAHQKAHGAVSNFDLPVIAHLVACSMGRTQWIRTTEIGRLVAKLMWATRAVVLHEMKSVMMTELLLSGPVYLRFQRFLVDGEDTVMSYLYNTQRLIKSLRGEDYNKADSEITDSLGRELRFRGSEISLSKVADMRLGLANEYEKIIKSEIFFDQPIPPWFTKSIDIRSLVDETRNNAAGYCFLDHPRNELTPMFVLYGEWLLSCSVRAAKFSDVIDGKVVWKSAPCYQLLQSFVKLRKNLCVRKIIDVGPSVRATEISRDLLRNLSGAAIRSFMILFHVLCIVGITDKTSHRILKNHFTPGAPSISTATDLIRNIVCFRRFESDLIRFFRGDLEAERYNIYLWPDITSNISGQSITESLAHETDTYLGVGLPVLEWRHVTTAFMNYHGNPIIEDDPGDNYHDLLSHHSTRTSQQKYGVDRNTLANAPTHHIMGCLRATIKWQALTASPGDVPLSLTVSHLPSILLPDVATDNPPDAAGVSRGDVVAIVQETRTQCAAEFKESMITSFATLAATYFPPPPPPRPPHALRPTSTVMVDPSRLVALQRFFEPQWDPNRSGLTRKFRSPEQGELIEKMLAREHHVLAILPCDFGKTTLLMFLAKIYESHLITVVILPLSGLHRDFSDRAKEHGLAISQWDPTKVQTSQAVSICYVAVEYAVMDSFLEYLLDINRKKLLSRIVLDEAHIILTAVAYREPLARIFRTLGVEVHCTALSGTIPEHLLADFRRITRLEWDVMRMPSQRPNITYGVVVAPRDEYKQKAVNYITARVANVYEPGDKAMVFCRTVALAEEIAGMLNTKAYHSKKSAEERERIYTDWEQGKEPVMVSTSVLGAGVNQDNVQDTCHVHLSHSLIDQVQEENRAGRNNQPARAIYFLPSDAARDVRVDVGDPFGADLLVPWAFNTEDCRRLQISLFMDGIAVTCLTLPGAALCDNCRRKALDPQRKAPTGLIPLPVPDPKAVRLSMKIAMPVGPPSGSRAFRNSSAMAPPLAGPPLMLPFVPPVNQAQAPHTITAGFAASSSQSEEEDDGRDVFGMSLPLPLPLPQLRAAATVPAPPARAPSPSWDPMSSISLRSSASTAPPVHALHQAVPPRQANTAPVGALASTSRQATAALLSAPAHQANTAPAPGPGLPVKIGYAAQVARTGGIDGVYLNIDAALKKLVTGCAACWGRGLDGWALHTLETCSFSIGNGQDQWFSDWETSAFTAHGYCFGCCRPSKTTYQKAKHKWLQDVRECPHKTIIKSAIYSWVTRPMDSLQWTSHVPPDIVAQIKDFTGLWTWLSVVESNAGETMLTNLLRLFNTLVQERKLLI
ncbi:hypothetical protein DFH07DRAFT_1016628 [Mycena maculata]|uniref:DNA 3'-5' helicase n=1 Tax=Mycena maculata TaxID=230809 RepID=A0AAD7JIE1_9AGAR|nr:hypothetical protein DFH07DRAFT_1016628 [Mycena maculata]